MIVNKLVGKDGNAPHLYLQLYEKFTSNLLGTNHEFEVNKVRGVRELNPSRFIDSEAYENRSTNTPIKGRS